MLSRRIRWLTVALILLSTLFVLPACTPDVNGGNGVVFEGDDDTGGGEPPDPDPEPEPPDMGETVTTEFDFIEPGDFTAGDAPITADFDNGMADGDAWIITSRKTGIVSFATPASAVDFSFLENFAPAAAQKAPGGFFAKTTCGVTGTGDPAEAYGVPFFVRGSYDGWANPPAAEAQFENLGASIYEAEFEITGSADPMAFKVASEDWSTVDFTADGLIEFGQVVTLVPGLGATDTTIVLAEDGCYNFRLDVLDTAAPVLTVTKVELGGGKTTCGVTGTGDAAEAYGVPFFVRGSYDDWANPPAAEAQFENLGASIYEAEFEIAGSADPMAFKVASEDWSTVDFTGDGLIELGQAVTLVPGLDAENTTIVLAADGCYNFRLDVLDPAAPVLIVTEVDLSGGGKTTCGVEGTGDPAEAYGVPFFVRGSYDDWANPPAAEAQFENLGASIYEAEFEIAGSADPMAFKVASEDWSTVDFTGDGLIELGQAVTLVPGLDAENTTIVLAADGCYNFRLDVLDPAVPVLIVTEVDLSGGGKTTCGVEGTGDPAEAYGVPFFVRGSYDDWANPPAAEAQFENLGASIYEAEFEIAGSADPMAFKVASEDWSTVDFTGDGLIELGQAVTLVPGLDAENTTIVLAADGCYNFNLDVLDTAAPVLTVTEVDLSGGGPPPTPEGSEARVYDVDGNLIETIEGTGDTAVMVERGDGESLIGRVEVENIGGVGDVGVPSFTWTADPADAPLSNIAVNYTSPTGDYTNVTVVFSGGASETVTCVPIEGEANLGCTASIVVPFGTAVDYSVQVDGVEDASGSTTADQTGGTTSAFSFASDNLLHVASPEWPEQIIFFLMTDRYNNGDPSNDCIDDVACDATQNSNYSGGDFQGIIQELDYIKGLGATAIWITPPVANQWWDPLVNFGGYHGYWQEDISETDAHYGTLNDYKLLSDALHRNDMFLIQDVVVNHTGNFFTYPGGDFDPEDPSFNCKLNVNSEPVGATPSQSPLDQNNCFDPAQTVQEIYHFTPQILDFNDPDQELTYALSDLDDLATENPVVRDLMKDSFGYWITEVGVDGFRIDTVKFVEHEFYQDWLHSDDLDHPGIAKSAESVGRLDFLDFGEVFNTSTPFETQGEEKIASYQGTVSQPEVQALIQFPLYQENLNVIASGQPTSQMRFRLEAFMNPDFFRDPYVTPTFLDNHDVARWLTSGNRESLKQGLTFLMTLPGIPVIYMGTAQAFTETRQAMFAEGFASGGIDWFDTSTEMYQLIAELSAIRKGSRTLTRGDLVVLSENEQSVGGLTYRRDLAEDGSTALVIMNTADEPILVSGVDTGLDPGTQLTLVRGLVAGGATAVDANGQLALRLESRDMLLYDAGDVGPVPDPGVTITIDNPPNGATFEAPFDLTGTVTSSVTALDLVIDELVDRGTPVTITPGDPATWTVEIPLGGLALNDRNHKLVVYDPNSSATSITDTFKSTFVPPSAIVSIQDPPGDDKGPNGTYIYPTDPSFIGNEGDLLNIEARAAGRNMTLTLSMAVVQNSFGAGTFDHVSFNILFDLSGEDGISLLPEIDAVAPDGFLWDFQHRVYGFGTGLHSKENASADFRGESVTGSPATVVDFDADTIAFTYDADDFGLNNWTGIKVYVTSWDIDGIEDVHRPLVEEVEAFKFGGRQNPDDDLILDDAAVIEIPPPP